jgi:subtilisin-like proprotein convertase family protein
MHQATVRRARLVLLTIGIAIVARGVSRADVNNTPIAIPLIGTQQIANPYPSSIDVVARGGPSQTGPISVVLHGVTHPCPRDLSVLLVHNDEKYLIMNNVGGCRPFEGTTIEIVDNLGDPTIPPNQPPDAPPFPDYIKVAASFDGPQPTPPAPFPSGGFITSGFPGATTLIDGRWDLYVIDKVAGGRGVIAGGWSLHYDTTIRSDFRQIGLIPGGGFSSGPAQVYPIRFDLSGVPEHVRAQDVTLTVDFSHQKPDDLVIVLQSPTGTAVMLMANAGGAINCPGVQITFDDAALGSRPLNDGPLPTGTGVRFMPTEWPQGGVPASVPAPGPQPPYANALFAFRNQPVRGVWTLWIADDSTNGTGLFAGSTLAIRTGSLPDATVASPTVTSTSTQPFVRVTGQLSGDDRRGDHATWRVTNGGAWYAAGAFTVNPETGEFSADVPVKRGVNTIQYRGWNTSRNADVGTLQVSVNELTYSLAEGAVSDFYDLDVTVANAGGVTAPVRVDLLPQGAAPIAHQAAAAPASPLQLSINQLLPMTAAVSTIVHSLDAQPLVVERTMSWDARGYGGHGGSSASPATRWLFAEGAQNSFFQTFVLLANDNATPAEVTIRFLLEGAAVVTHRVTVPARSRETVYAGRVAGVDQHSFGLDITATAPIIAERAMYFSQDPNRVTFDGGHESAGVNEPSTRWFLAEGATGPTFDCFVLLSNPNGSPAHVTVTYLLPDGQTITRPITLAANGRHTINVASVDNRLVNAAVSTTIQSDIGIVAERAMYWPSGPAGWHEAHNSFGVTEAGLRWGLADGRIGGSRAYSTFILLANPNPAPAEVEVRFFQGGRTATRTYTVAPTSRMNVPLGDVHELIDGVFSAEIEVLNFQPIAVEKAMYWNASGVTWAAGTNVTATRLPPR